MADISKVGQAFRRGADVWAGGILQKESERLDEERWRRRQEEVAGRKAAEDEKASLLRQLEREFSSDPELVPFATRAREGDPSAVETLSIYAGLREQLATRNPFNEAYMSAVQQLPPMTRSRLISENVKLMQDIQDREAADAKAKADAEYRELQKRNLEAQIAEREAKPAERETAEAAKLRELQAKDIEGRVSSHEAKQKALDQVNINILTLKQTLGEYLAKIKEPLHITDANFEKIRKTLKAARGIADPSVAILDKIVELHKTKARLEEKLVDPYRDRAPELMPEEAPARMEEELPPEIVSFLNNLSDKERAEIYAALQARPELSQEDVIRAYWQYRTQGLEKEFERHKGRHDR